MKTCFCCRSLRVGCIFIALLNLLGAIALFFIPILAWELFAAAMIAVMFCLAIGVVKQENVIKCRLLNRIKKISIFREDESSLLQL